MTFRVNKVNITACMKNNWILFIICVNILKVKKKLLGTKYKILKVFHGLKIKSYS